MKRFAMILFAAVFAVFGANAADSLTMADFGHSIELMVDGYTGSETLANFPVLVRVSESIPGFHYADMSAINVNGKALGYDLAFFAEDGTRLACDQDTWDINKTVGNTGEQLVWVKLPQMTQGTRFYMCYSVANGVYVTNDNPWAEYVGVWHMKESSGTVADATGNNLDATPGGNNTANSIAVDGKLGKARQNAVSGSQGNLTVPSYSSVYSGTTFTASGWFYQTAYNGNDSRLFSRKSNYDVEGGWETFSKTVNPNKPNASFGKIQVRGYKKDKTLASKANIDLTNKWTHLTFAYNGTTVKMYTNGVAVVSDNNPIQLPSDNGAALGIGNYNTGTGNASFFGYIDECRLLKSTASADWVKAEYDTVNDPNFVTAAPKNPPAVSWANDSGSTPGVDDVSFDSLVFAGSVQNCGDFDTCGIQYKIWADGAAEPGWTTLTSGLVASDTFEVTVPGLAAETAYNYRLRAIGDDDNVASAAVSGAFTTEAGLTVVFPVVSGRAGISRVVHNFVVVSGEVTAFGSAATCEIQYKVWEEGAADPGWTTLTNGIDTLTAFTAPIVGLSTETTYNYALRAAGNDGTTTTPVSGTFTTAAGLTITWSLDSGETGFSNISYDFASVGGVVSALGGAEECVVLGKVWADGAAEPNWETLAEDLSLDSRFTKTISGLARGTTYKYKLCAVGDDDSVSAIVTGTFTTQGINGDEEVGSSYTHLYDDGTNAFWVANEFERYLRFEVTGYTGTETLTNFPVLVDVRKKDTNGFTYDDFYHYDGADMAFVDEKGHIIPHEIDTWNKTGMSLIWVRLPEMVNGTKFTMCYRCPLVDPMPDPGNTFERYVGVWHMNETKNGVVELKDSTINNHAGETHAESLAGINEGQMIGGNCRRVAQSPGSSATYGRIIAFNGDDDLIRTGVGNVFTFSGWYKLAATPPKWAYLVSRKTMDQDVGWGIQCEETSTSKLRVWSGSNAKNQFQLFNVPGKGGFGTSWHYWTFIFDGSVNQDGTTNRLFHAYLDGNAITNNLELSYPVVNDANAAYENLVIGGQQIGTGAFNGLVDEARYSKGIRSPDWIKAEYLSTKQKDNHFVTKGTEVFRGVESAVPVVVWERGEGLPDTILDVSYAYVQFAGTVTYCGLDATECRIEYQIWVEGEDAPETWTTLVDHVPAGRRFSIPVTGLKQDMPYNFRIRAVNEVNGHEQQNREHVGSFRTNGNVNMQDVEGELIRLEDKFVHRFRAGTYNFYTPDYVTNVEIMVVGGGGAGGYGIGGGGGGGGLFYSQSYLVTTNTHYRIHVGAGGIAPSNTTMGASSGNGEHSYFALAGGEADPLIMVPGGGGGGSYADSESVAMGAIGGSGGGGTYAKEGGTFVSNEVDGVMVHFGHAGGRGNNALDGGSSGKTAAGGGGGAGRAGTSASFDAWWSGGAGGVGVGNAMTGEMLYYGAGGGGGYAYKVAVASDGSDNFTKPGAGGSGIGGNAADIRNGTLATSGVPNTGAGGGGGSKRDFNEMTPNEFWQGGNGGDGVVLICYEVHGRDPIAEEPRITMTMCDYTDEKGYADIGYRAYWAGVQMEKDDIYVLYSTVSEEDVAACNGEHVSVVTNSIGIGETTFTPPEVGYTYYVRLMARKDANSYMYSDEIGTFFVPAIRNNGSNWHMPNAESNEFDNVDIQYALYYDDPDAHLYLYWSENEDDVNGDTAPSGTGVHFLDLGTGRQSRDGKVNLPASVGFERNKVYYTRLATGNEAGTKYFLSPRTMILQTIDKPRVIFPEATWSNNVATVEFIETTSHLDPQEVDLVAYYGTLAEIYGDNGKLDKMANAISNTAHRVNLGKCFLYPDDLETVTQFPMWSPVDTNYYVRLTLETNGVIVAISQRYQSLDVITAVPANTLLVYVNEEPHVSCYGDDPATPSYNVAYGGYTEGPGWDHWTNAMWIVGSPYCPVTRYSPSGQYDVTQGDLTLSSLAPYVRHEPVLNQETGEPVVDEQGNTVTEDVYYYYMLCYTSSRHVVTNAFFSLSIEDISLPYTGEPVDTSSLVCTTNSEPRNGLPISYLYRVSTNEWTSTMPSGYTDVGSFIVQFKATADSHNDVFGTFMVTVTPTPLSATISTPDIPYTGDAQTPVVTTNVTGLMHGDINPLTCSFRDEAGEWLGYVPSFTQPGVYKLFFRVEAPNHTSFVTNCTFTITGWDFMVNMDGEDGYGTPIAMGRPSWLIEKSGMTGEQLADNTTRYEALDTICPNGLRLWQNYIIERKDFSQKVVATIRQHGSLVLSDTFVVHFPNIEPLAKEITGLKVQYRLDKKLKGGITNKSEFAAAPFVKGELTGKYETNIPLGPEDPTGLYVFNLVFSSTNEQYTGESVISSCATIGVLRVSSALTNTVTVAPWRSMSIDSAAFENVSVDDVVNPTGISSGDAIYFYNRATTNFTAWASDGNGGWDSVATVSRRGVSEPSAEATRFSVGNAFWLVRSAPTDYIYLIGRYTGEPCEVEIAGGTAEAPGNILIANPTMHDIDLNDLEFVDGEGNPASPAAGDRITVMDIAGMQTIYARNAANTSWGRKVLVKVGRRTRQDWVEGGTIPAGTGFWYKRTASGTLKIRFDTTEE